jgi:hypothetical protein
MAQSKKSFLVLFFKKELLALSSTGSFSTARKGWYSRLAPLAKAALALTGLILFNYLL